MRAARALDAPVRATIALLATTVTMRMVIELDMGLTRIPLRITNIVAVLVIAGFIVPSAMRFF